MSYPAQFYADSRYATQAKLADKRKFGATQARYPYYVLTQDVTKLNIYGEVAEGASPGEPEFTLFGVSVPMRVILDPSKDLLKKWGIEGPRDALVEFSIAILEELALVPKIGDRFNFNLEQYELMTASKEAYHRNLKIPIRSVMAAMKARRVKAA